MPGAAQTSRAIYTALKAQIADGTLAAGALLPSTRALAADLSVSRTTITAVYEQLAAEGYLETQPGKRARAAAGVVRSPPARQESDRAPERSPRLSAYGARVAGFAAQAESVVPAGNQPVIEFLYGALAFDDFPTLAWRKAYNRAIVRRQRRLYYEAPEGEAALRNVLQAYLRRARGLACAPEQILMVHGSQQAIDLCARVLVDPSDPVLIEEPCYLMARRIFEATGAQVGGVPVDEHGLLTQHLSGRPARLIYVTPSHQFPLGGVMPIGRRQALLSWARRVGAWVVEDDYDGEFRYGLRPVDTLQSIDASGCVIYVGTFSKALSPQMRLGYLVLPQSLVGVFREAKRLMDRHAPSLDQRVLADLIEAGIYERHVRKSRRHNEHRRTVLLQALARYLPGMAEVEGSASGLHVVVWFTSVPQSEEAALVRQAWRHGVGVRPVSPLYAEGDKFRVRACAGLVLGYASLTAQEIEEGVRRLAGAVGAAP